jgi:hydroxymethylpyrimidine pyrophosphatase-like HAD family hydrolase
MRYQALATDYDGTLATRGIVDNKTVAALARLRASGRKLLLVTGRELSDLSRVFPHLDVFDRVVAEYGAVLFNPATAQETLLCAPAYQRLASALRKAGVPVSVGRAVLATNDRYLAEVGEAISKNGLRLRITLNKGSVMVLPEGVTKATGLMRALNELDVRPENVVGIGDAENDTDFLHACGLAVAVANALPALKSQANLVTSGAHGRGVAEVIQHLLRDDLAGVASRGRRQ